MPALLHIIDEDFMAGQWSMQCKQWKNILWSELTLSHNYWITLVLYPLTLVFIYQLCHKKMNDSRIVKYYSGSCFTPLPNAISTATSHYVKVGIVVLFNTREHATFIWPAYSVSSTVIIDLVGFLTVVLRNTLWDSWSEFLLQANWPSGPYRWQPTRSNCLKAYIGSDRIKH